MNLRQFRHLLESRGSDLSWWPADLRTEAERLAAVNPDATAALACARRLDALIAREMGRVRSTATPDELSPELQASATRVSARLERALPRQRRRLIPSWWPTELLELDFTPAWSRIAALGCVAVVGFAIGLTEIRLPGASATYGSSAIAYNDSDLSTIVFERDPLPRIRVQ